ncbi:MAG TPA: YihY/virulence factor BrkB family protein [Trebonia sp.]|nr:YihY/virulence factor BrkB family protein [Trebonia sp.]
MNPVERMLRKADSTQQRFRPSAFVFGVMKKYGDDNGGVLVANLTHSAFVSIFPLLLVMVTILGLVAASDPSFRQEAANAVASQVPIIGRELTGNVHQLRKSSLTGLIAGLAVTVWGATGLAQAGLFTMEQVWNLPGPARPGFVPRLGRALLFLVLLGLVVVATMLLASLSTYGQHALSFLLFIEAAEATANAGMYFAAFRVLTPKGVPSRDLVPGAVAAGICWTAVQVAGVYLIHHYLHSDSVYGIFATVLGLVAWLYIAAEITVYCAEINVVLARRLWPRAIIQPPLTEADRASMALQALQNQRRPEQRVTVTFDDREPGASAADTAPHTPGEVSPPAPRPPRKPGKPAKEPEEPRPAR